MSRKTKDKGRLPPFVPLFVETLATEAWRNLSHGAQALYVALKGRVRFGAHNNGRVYLSQRDAQKQLRSGTTQIARWYRELQHYGFIVRTRGGSLGVGGRGFAPHWRLTELGYHRELPTKDFLRWNGEPFKDEPRRRSKTESRKQNPVPEKQYGVHQKTGT
jgi:hypothetical protein